MTHFKVLDFISTLNARSLTYIYILGARHTLSAYDPTIIHYLPYIYMPRLDKMMMIPVVRKLTDVTLLCPELQRSDLQQYVVREYVTP